MLLHSVEAAGRLEDDARSRPERARQAGLGIVPNAAITTAVTPDGQVVRVPLIFNEVVAAPEEQMATPSPRHRSGAAEKPRPRRALRGGAVGHVTRHECICLERGALD